MVRLLTPDDRDSVIEYAHLCVALTLIYHDVLGSEAVRGQMARKLDRIKAVRDAGAWPHLAALRAADTTATVLRTVQLVDWYGERHWQLTERVTNV